MKTLPKALSAALAATWLALPLCLVSGQQPSPSENSKPTPPSIAYWHVYTDKDGTSHQVKETLQSFELESVKPPAAPQWIDQLQKEGASLTITVQPVGWMGTWHENPHRQWIIPVSGKWFVETMDGTRVEMGPGEVSLGEDQGTKPDAKGHQGHLSGTVGNEPFVAMIVQLPDVPKSQQPTRFK